MCKDFKHNVKFPPQLAHVQEELNDPYTLCFSALKWFKKVKMPTPTPEEV
jgi:hypothetical protein